MQTEFPERYITLGLKIAYYRKKAGMTQEVLAERIGKSVNFVGQVEGTGTVRGISLETLFKIAQVLKIRRFSYAETPCRSTWEIILPLHGKAVTAGFFDCFEP